MLQLITSISVALVSALSSWLPALFRTSPRSGRRIEAHAHLLATLPQGSKAQRLLSGLIDDEMRKFIDEERRRGSRKVNFVNFTLTIIVALVGGGAVYGIWALARITPVPWSVVLYVFAGLIGLFTIALDAAGLAQIYDPPTSKGK
jgi:hypothetical protein